MNVQFISVRSYAVTHISEEHIDINVYLPVLDQILLEFSYCLVNNLQVGYFFSALYNLPALTHTNRY